MTEEAARIADGYRRFGRVEAAEASPLYARLCEVVAADAEILRFLAAMPTGKRQPNLLFAAMQYLHGRAPEPAELHGWVCDDAERLRSTMLARATQTNEPARCTALLPLMAALPGPLALIEAGASAGLCLYPDRYAYDYDGVAVGPSSPVRLRCTVTGGGPVPRTVPDVVVRIGIDRNPLDPRNPDDVAWLRALIWPGPAAEERLARLAAAGEVAAREPARMITGDLLERLPEALDLVPEGATAVVFHTAVLLYLPRAARAAFVELVRSRPVRWIAQEGLEVLPEVDAQLSEDQRVPGSFVLSLDGRPVALTAPHGGRIDWLPGASEIIGG